MVEHSRSKDGVASARPGHPRLPFPQFTKDVDARDKRGHDDVEFPDP
jgi:hypothetical protein